MIECLMPPSCNLILLVNRAIISAVISMITCKLLLAENAGRSRFKNQNFR